MLETCELEYASLYPQPSNDNNVPLQPDHTLKYGYGIFIIYVQVPPCKGTEEVRMTGQVKKCDGCVFLLFIFEQVRVRVRIKFT